MPDLGLGRTTPCARLAPLGGTGPLRSAGRPGRAHALPAPNNAGSDQRKWVELTSNKRRAMTNIWICWVPSKMSRILESRAHFSSSSVSP
jgi:hypothetical protein